MNSKGPSGDLTGGKQGVNFPYGFPGSLNPHQISLPPRRTKPPAGARFDPSPNQPAENLKPSSEKLDMCFICDRPRTVVTCSACGYRKDNLRVQLPCPLHGRVQFLTDLKECPRCHTNNLVEEPRWFPSGVPTN